MISDIYIRDYTDPNFQYGVLSHNDAIESIISKIKMILGTRQGEILGDVAFGVGIEDLIFETKISKTHLEEKIKTQFDQYIAETKDYKITPVVSFGREDGYEYAIVDIYINNAKIVGILVK